MLKKMMMLVVGLVMLLSSIGQAGEYVPFRATVTAYKYYDPNIGVADITITGDAWYHYSGGIECEVYQAINEDSVVSEFEAWAWVQIDVGFAWVGDGTPTGLDWKWSYWGNMHAWSGGSEWGNGSVRLDGDSLAIVAGSSYSCSLSGEGWCNGTNAYATANYPEITPGVNYTASTFECYSDPQGKSFAEEHEGAVQTNHHYESIPAGQSVGYVSLVVFVSNKVKASNGSGQNPEWALNGHSDVNLTWTIEER